MAKKKKYYVVWRGVNEGIFDTWDTCQLQIKGYPGAQYASFTSKEAAIEAYENGYDAFRSGKNTSPKASSKKNRRPPVDLPKNTWSVDAACSGNPGKMEYRGVFTDDGTEIFRKGPFLHGTNNIGEFLALVRALAMLDRLEDHKTIIFSDSRIAMGWVRKGKCNTKLKRTPGTKVIHDMIAAAEKWLANHKIKNPIRKWETKEWGEIPADFGRK